MFPKQYRIHAVLMISCLVMIFYPMISEKPDPEKAEGATAAAMQFLTLVDADKFEQSWEDTADLLKKKISRKDWNENLAKARGALGPVIERAQEGIKYSSEAKDSPEGDYIVLIFESRFQAADDITETVTVMLEEDGVWRVAGYYVQ